MSGLGKPAVSWRERSFFFTLESRGSDAFLCLAADHHVLPKTRYRK
jgi:hypothetical protein